jgi:hypothetical protein
LYSSSFIIIQWRQWRQRHTKNAQEHTNEMQKWPHYKIKCRKKIRKTYEKKIFE